MFNETSDNKFKLSYCFIADFDIELKEVPKVTTCEESLRVLDNRTIQVEQGHPALMTCASKCLKPYAVTG